MKRLPVLLSVATLLTLSASAAAFDGQRQGFVLGGGLGLTPTAHWSTQYAGREFSEDAVGWGEHVLVGYGWDERNILGVEINIASYNSSVFGVDLVQGLVGLSWYHYFGKPGNSFFSVAGAGASRLVEGFGTIYIDISFGESPVKPPLPDGATGTGYLLGGGYEFYKHYQIAAYLTGGNPSEYGSHYGTYHVIVMLSAFAF